MPGFRISNFYGIVPRLHPADLKPGYAAVAEDVRLSHGTLEAWRERLPLLGVAPASQTIHLIGCCWFAWDKCVEVAEWLPSCPRLYVTGDQPYPTVGVVNSDCSASWSRVGVPDPGRGPVASATVPNPMSEASEGRDYVFTYTNCLCEEGPPSWPSNEVVVDDGAPVTLTGFPPPPSGEWCVTEMNIYRRVTGFRTGREQVQEHVTDYFLVGTVPVGTATFIDSARNREIGRALPTREFSPPPANLRGITAIPNTQTLVGFVGNDLWFSANGQPWNWPEAQRMTLDDPIVALRAVDTTLYVATTGAPYTIQGEGDCNERACRKVKQHNAPLPMITCCSNRGSVATPFGMVYVSADGLVLLAGNNPPQVITDQWFGQDDWRKLRPDTMRLGYYAGTLFCVSDVYAFMLTIDAKTYANWETYKLSSLSDRPKFLHTGSNGELFFLEAGQVSQWNAGTTLRPYTWESKLLEAAGSVYYLAARVWCDDGAAAFTLKASERPVFSRVVNGRHVFRIRPYGRHMLHSVILQGVSRVWGVHVASSMRDLAQNGANQ